jgi:hypothetical protein
MSEGEKKVVVISERDGVALLDGAPLENASLSRRVLDALAVARRSDGVIAPDAYPSPRERPSLDIADLGIIGPMIKLSKKMLGGRAKGVPVRAGAKVGRNEKCPCGSGRKHKRCCGVGALR